MGLLRLLEQIRNPVFDAFFSLITHLGEETVFMAIAILFFWCVNKREGLYILLTGFAGTLVNQTLKLLFRIPRPWVLDPDFTIVESARAQAAGYSFPSGHTQNAVGIAGNLFMIRRRIGVRVAVITLSALIAFSRMYLGVHTPWDVLASVGAAILLVLILEPFFRDDERMDRAMPWIDLAFLLGSVAYLVFVLLQPDGIHDEVNLASGLKNACTLLGCSLALLLIRFLDRRFLRFETAARWYVQILKFVVGVAGVFGIKAGLSSPLTALFGNEYVARTVRYFLIVAFAGAGWPFFFRYLVKIRVPALDRFGEKVAALLWKKETKPEN